MKIYSIITNSMLKLPIVTFLILNIFFCSANYAVILKEKEEKFRIYRFLEKILPEKIEKYTDMNKPVYLCVKSYIPIKNIAESGIFIQNKYKNRNIIVPEDSLQENLLNKFLKKKESLMETKYNIIYVIFEKEGKNSEGLEEIEGYAAIYNSENDFYFKKHMITKKPELGTGSYLAACAVGAGIIYFVFLAPFKVFQ